MKQTWGQKVDRAISNYQLNPNWKTKFFLKYSRYMNNKVQWRVTRCRDFMLKHAPLLALFIATLSLIVAAF